MKIIDTLKSWLGMGAKPEPEQPPAEATKTVTLPNGRLAVVDERGNFIRFADQEPRP